jgi:hypothetical protein
VRLARAALCTLCIALPCPRAAGSGGLKLARPQAVLAHGSFTHLVLANYVGWGHNMDSLFWDLYQAIAHQRAFMIDSRYSPSVRTDPRVP